MIHLSEQAIKHVIELSGNNPEVIEYFEKRVSSIKNKKAARARREVRANNKIKKKLEAHAEKFREQLIKNQTPAEVKFKAFLKSLDIEYEFQKIIYNDKTFHIVDFFLPEKGFVVELDGGYHQNKRQKGKDTYRAGILKKAGVLKVYRFRNEETDDSVACIEKIKRKLKLDVIT